MDNIILQDRKMLPQKVKELLDSDDMEMVNLGVQMMKQYVPKEFWFNILEMFSFKGGEQYETGYGNLYVRKWKFSISGDDIFLTDDHPKYYEYHESKKKQ